MRAGGDTRQLVIGCISAHVDIWFVCDRVTEHECTAGDIEETRWKSLQASTVVTVRVQICAYFSIY